MGTQLVLLGTQLISGALTRSTQSGGRSMGQSDRIAPTGSPARERVLRLP
jgi:hypothetical protein